MNKLYTFFGTLSAFLLISQKVFAIAAPLTTDGDPGRLWKIYSFLVDNNHQIKLLSFIILGVAIISLVVAIATKNNQGSRTKKISNKVFWIFIILWLVIFALSKIFIPVYY
ncbi:MAG: hypothetical protein OEX08_00720 [Candidatus Nomurabacteria bacterium]|nr:hypothetical protein [Candidatus Nomurabacteria bacterium]